MTEAASTTQRFQRPLFQRLPWNLSSGFSNPLDLPPKSFISTRGIPPVPSAWPLAFVHRPWRTTSRFSHHICSHHWENNFVAPYHMIYCQCAPFSSMRNHVKERPYNVVTFCQCASSLFKNIFPNNHVLPPNLSIDSGLHRRNI